jgi:uncharacterized protein YndB with AHSA1/START domain
MIAPIRREITVPATAERAFALFIDNIGDWWPLHTHGVFGDGTVALEGELLVERSGERESVWAEVSEWDPPRTLSLRWHPGGTPENATLVTVTFERDASATRVTLVHTGWETITNGAEHARDYDTGWIGVLDRFAALAGAENFDIDESGSN